MISRSVNVSRFVPARSAGSASRIAELLAAGAFREVLVDGESGKVLRAESDAGEKEGGGRDDETAREVAEAGKALAAAA